MSVVIQRLAQEGSAAIDRLDGGRRGRSFNVAGLLRATHVPSLDRLWEVLADRPFPFNMRPVERSAYGELAPGDEVRILRAAQRALEHQVDLLGSGPVDLGPTIDWLQDFKTGHSWPPAFMRDIDYLNLDRGSDVKVPWELSRLQWMIPAGQAYLLTGDERYAAAVRDVLDDWIVRNPYAGTVNWSCTMEAALRIVSWTWFFHAFARSTSWAHEDFRGRFLVALFLHGRFTHKYLESAEINGNHCAADAAGLVFAGLFFGGGSEPERWAREGWHILDAEIARQVSDDGVDYEGSIAYHRLVFELFLYPTMYRTACGVRTPDAYRERLTAMAQFVASYSRSDGSTPLVGDADDGRMLPLGGQALGDHRYLIGVAASTVTDTLHVAFSGSVSEVFWLCGDEAVRTLSGHAPAPLVSSAFAAAGYYVMRNPTDHVFIDCAPVGLAGLGGHGHSDCLSFEAVLADVLLVCDSGSYVYTASAAERNHFRSTDVHNTPGIDGQEMNRLVAPDNLWQLHPDAVPEVREWRASLERDVFVGSHSGYMRLDQPIRPVRTIELDHAQHTLRVEDRFEGVGEHDVAVPLHFAPSVSVEQVGTGELRLTAAGRSFHLRWTTEEWRMSLEPARVSTRYGVTVSSSRAVWRGRVGAAACLTVWITTDVSPGRTLELPL